ncbi:unnamed protein product [Meganyctiphanes norvegica]|uniref:Uncharacterized protein n=1 Tax=Meganyctiphanes norvegica TaxID=48144 RepID=A0AAV2QXX7_MEGNR
MLKPSHFPWRYLSHTVHLIPLLWLEILHVEHIKLSFNTKSISGDDRGEVLHIFGLFLVSFFVVTVHRIFADLTETVPFGRRLFLSYFTGKLNMSAVILLGQMDHYTLRHL